MSTVQAEMADRRESGMGREPATRGKHLRARITALTSMVTQGKELAALGDQALVSGANFITNILLARSLGLSGFGIYALSWMVVLLWSNLQMATLVVPMMSVGPKQAASHRPAYFGALGKLAGCFALLASVMTYGGSLVLAAWPRLAVVRHLALPLAVATGAYLLQDFTRRYFFSVHCSRRALQCDAISYLTQLPILYLAVLSHRLTIGVALWIIALTSLLSAAVSTLWMRDLCFRTAAMMTVLRRHAPLVRWLAPSALLQWLSLNLFTVFAPVYYGAAAAGALRACQNLVAVAHIWFLGLDNVVPAEAARCLHERGVGLFLRYLRAVTLRWGMVTLLFMLALSAAPAFWLHLLYGPQYVQYSFVLRLYGVLYMMIFLGTPLRAGLQAMEFTSPLLWAYLAMTAFTAMVAGPAARHLGLMGVMLGLIATQFIFQIIMGAALLVRAKRMQAAPPMALPA